MTAFLSRIDFERGFGYKKMQNKKKWGLK
jgi:hypothetical protein